MLNFKIDSNVIDKIGNFSKEEKNFRLKNLSHFNNLGFPNKKYEDWKFSDLREIVSKNFKKLKVKSIKSKEPTVDFIKDFDHNYIIVINGELTLSNFKFEEKDKIKIKTFLNENFSNDKETNPLINLNNALSDMGFSLEVKEKYKFKKILVIYYLFTNDLNENILNTKNKIRIGKESELHVLELIINKSTKNFFNNVYENITLEEKAIFKNICVQNEKSSGYFHKYSKNKLSSKSNFSSFVFPSGMKFNKLDLEFDLDGENSECNLQSASFLNHNDHQEIKTRINHFSPNCKSYQKVKNVLNLESKGIFQGKIFVKDVAQKTNAYQLSKALILNDKAEFDAKPELEIYADDVKCSHGSTSGSIDTDAIHYLMTRGIDEKTAKQLLINGFLNDILDNITATNLKKFVEITLEGQINGY